MWYCPPFPCSQSSNSLFLFFLIFVLFVIILDKFIDPGPNTLCPCAIDDDVGWIKDSLLVYYSEQKSEVNKRQEPTTHRKKQGEKIQLTGHINARHRPSLRWFPRIIWPPFFFIFSISRLVLFSLCFCTRKSSRRLRTQVKKMNKSNKLVAVPGHRTRLFTRGQQNKNNKNKLNKKKKKKKKRKTLRPPWKRETAGWLHCTNSMRK